MSSIPTREQVESEQVDLQALCRDRPLASAEVFPDNPLYGHDRVIKAYAQLPPGYPLKVAIPHGIVDTITMPFYSARELVPVLTYAHLRDREQARRQGVAGRLWPMASPFVYATRLVKAQENGRPRQGTLFFPSHSTMQTSADVDFEDLAAEVAQLDAPRHPVTVCMYWRDVQLGNHEPFLAQGLRVVSAGHMHDPDFLFRLVHLCQAHRFAASNELGSHVFYAIHAGCAFFTTGGVRRCAGELDAVRHPEARHLFEVLPQLSDWLQRSAVAPYVGAEHVLPPDELRRTLLRAELLDKVAFREPDARDRPRWTLPAAARRGVRAAVPKSLRRTSTAGAA